MLASWLWRASRVLLPVLCLLFASPAAAQNSWRWISPHTTGNSLYDLCFSDEETAFAVGEVGTVIRTEDGGESWEALASGTTERLQDVEFFDRTRGVVVGDDGTLLVTGDGGTTWIDRSGTDSNGLLDIRGIAYLAADTLIAVSGHGPVIRITDEGRTWANVHDAPASIFDSFDRVHVVDGSRWSVGGGGLILRTGDGGATWTEHRIGADGDVRSVAFLDDSTGIAVGVHTILRTTDGGSTWTNQPAFRLDEAELIDVWFADGNVGLAWGGKHIYLTEDAGLSWQRLTDSAPGQLRRLRFDSRGAIFAVANKLGILKSIDYAQTWESKLRRVTEHNLRDVWQIDRDKAVAVGDHVILRTADGAVTWAETELDESVGLNSVRFFDSEWGVAVGSTILTTRDGGVTWAYRGYPGLPQLYDTDYLDASTLVSVGEEGTVLRSFDGGDSWSSQDSGTRASLLGVTFVTPERGWIVGSGGTVLQTVDGGSTWIPREFGQGYYLDDIAFVDEWTGMLVGPDARYRTTDGGTSWIDSGAPCCDWYVDFIDLEFAASGVGVLTQVILGIPRFTEILATPDGGTTWSHQFACGPFIGSVHVLDDGTAMAVGLGGRILRAESVLTGAEERPELAVPPTSVTLDQNYPNPFNPVTTIAYELARHAEVTMTVHDQLGRAVRTETLGWQAPGRHDVTFDAAGLSSGIYFYTLTAGDLTETRMMVLLR